MLWIFKEIIIIIYKIEHCSLLKENEKFGSCACDVFSKNNFRKSHNFSKKFWKVLKCNYFLNLVDSSTLKITILISLFLFLTMSRKWQSNHYFLRHLSTEHLLTHHCKKLCDRSHCHWLCWEDAIIQLSISLTFYEKAVWRSTFVKKNLHVKCWWNWQLEGRH